MCTVLDERESACDWADVEIFKLPLSWTLRHEWHVCDDGQYETWVIWNWDFEHHSVKYFMSLAARKVVYCISDHFETEIVIIFPKKKKKKIWIRSALTNYTIRKDTAGGITSTKYSAHTLNCNISGNYWLYDFSYQFWLEGLNFFCIWWNFLYSKCFLQLFFFFLDFCGWFS